MVFAVASPSRYSQLFVLLTVVVSQHAAIPLVAVQLFCFAWQSPSSLFSVVLKERSYWNATVWCCCVFVGRAKMAPDQKGAPPSLVCNLDRGEKHLPA